MLELRAPAAVANAVLNDLERPDARMTLLFACRKIAQCNVEAIGLVLEEVIDHPDQVDAILDAHSPALALAVALAFQWRRPTGALAGLRTQLDELEEQLSGTYCYGTTKATAREVAEWAGGAIASGVLGNATYDLLRKVADRRRRRGENDPPDAAAYTAVRDLAVFTIVQDRCRQVGLPCPRIDTLTMAWSESDETVIVHGPDLQARVWITRGHLAVIVRTITRNDDAASGS
jgi:hypothetical protein